MTLFKDCFESLCLCDLAMRDSVNTASENTPSLSIMSHVLLALNLFIRVPEVSV